MDTPVALQKTAVQGFDLATIAAELEREDAYRSSRRTAAALVKENDLTVVLTSVQKGETIREHAVPNAAYVMVLDGEVVMRFPDEEKRLSKGHSVAFAGGVRHSVDAIEDTRFLVVLGGKQEASHLME